MNSKRAVKVRKRQSEQGRPLRKGRWSAGEDDILVENLQRYYKENPMYNPILLLHSAKSNQKLLRTTKETLLYSRIAAGLNRTNSDAYNRARYYLFPNYEYKKGKYSIEEKTEMKKLFGIYGSNCITIGTKLGRNSRGLTRQWEHLQATKFGSWDEIEEQSLIEAVKQCSKAADDMHNYLPWMIIAKAIPGRHSDQCRHHWIHKLRNQVFKEEQCFETVIWEKSQTLELESEICIQGVAYEEDVDFDDIRQHFHKAGFVLTRDQARTQWRNLKRNVKNYYINSFGEILDEIVSHLVTDM